MPLKEYHKKRDFKKTPEPKGKVKKSKTKTSLFVIQKHAASHLHYDFRLELDGVLKSWAVPKGPCLDPSVKRLAMHVEDHPIEYGSFEGIIPKGQYGGGTVMVWDTGDWISEDESPANAYDKGNMTFQLNGKKLKGRWKLIRTKNEKSWLLMKLKDKYAKSLNEYDITIQKPNSVISNQTIEQITANYQYIWDMTGLKKSSKNKQNKKITIQKSKVKKSKLNIKINLPKTPMPEYIIPQMATLVDKPPIGEDWIHEIKFDGYRLIVIKKNGKTRLFTRNINDWTDKFTMIAEEINKLPVANLILDGEVVVLNENQQSDFQLLQNSIKQHSHNLLYYTFDIIYYDHYNLSPLTLLERKNILRQVILDENDLKSICYSDHIIGSGQEFFDKCCEWGLEGVVSKNINSPYVQKRTQSFLKIKCLQRQEFVIGGYTKPKGSRTYFGSLLLGTYDDGDKLTYHGNVGTGFTEKSLSTLFKLLKKHKTNEMPFEAHPPGATNVQWVKPELVAEVEFFEWTKDDILRQPSFKGLRADKSPKEIHKEKKLKVSQIAAKKESPFRNKQNPFHLTNPNKILYPKPKITKRQIAEYYSQISKWILPYVANRPLTLLRCPETFQECFYQKHLNEYLPPSIQTILIKEKENKEKYLYIEDEKGLLSLVQLDVLEIHLWGSRIEDVKRPDWFVFDLDPATDVPWKKVAKAALDVKQYLEAIHLKSFLKTTGGKGLHVVVPITPKYNWHQIKNFTHAFVNLLVEEHPKEYVSKMSKEKRKGKIYIDYLRNQRGATAIAPFSTRARENATVAIPIHWDELSNNSKDNTYTIKTVLQRMRNLKTDPWKNFFKIKQSLNL